MEVASVMIVTTILLSMVWYIVWGYIIIVPLAFLVCFGLLDGVFWAGTLSQRTTNAYDSDIEQIFRWSMVSIYGSHRYDLFHVILEVGNGEEACL
jgi:K+ transporter